MDKIKLIILLFSRIILFDLRLVDATSTDIIYFKDLRLFNFRHVGSIQYIHFNVPENTASLEWSMSLNKSHPSCESVQVLLLAQYGSFPISGDFDDSSLPPHYLLQRSQFLDSTLSSQPVIVSNPIHGQWFLGAVLQKDNNQIIQNLLARSCNYGINGSITCNKISVETLTIGRSFVLNINQTRNYYRFLTSQETYRFTATISHCTPQASLSIAFASGSLPNATSEPLLTVTCNATSSEDLVITSPDVEKWQYLLITPDQGSSSPLPDSLEITITLDECVSGLLKNHTGLIPCYLSTNLKTTTYPDEVQQSTFGFQDDDSESLFIPRKHVSMTTFVVEAVKDVGGFLILDFELIPISTSFFKSDLKLETKICVQRGRPPISANHSLSCKDDRSLLVLNSTKGHALIRFPYPEPGIYYIGYQDYSVIDNGSSTVSTPPLTTSKIISNHSFEDSDNSTYAVMMTAELSKCEHSKCENNGRCRKTLKGAFIISSCLCQAQTKGITCADDSEMVSHALQLLFTLMLTLSNLAFIPAIVVAFSRWRYIECMVYTLNMIFSTFYHACDMNAWSLYGFCIFDYNTLQYSDFLLSVLSFWVTLLAMSRIRSGYLLVFSTFGIILTAILIENDSTGAWNNAIPITLGVLLVIITWGTKCYKTKQIYPSKQDYYWIFPGFCLALIGIVIFATVENDINYPYTHSFWHLSVAFSVPFILPRFRALWKMNIIEGSFQMISRPEIVQSSEEDV